jgi:hypothetical protein
MSPNLAMFWYVHTDLLDREVRFVGTPVHAIGDFVQRLGVAVRVEGFAINSSQFQGGFWALWVFWVANRCGRASFVDGDCTFADGVNCGSSAHSLCHVRANRRVPGSVRANTMDRHGHVPWYTDIYPPI